MREHGQVGKEGTALKRVGLLASGLVIASVGIAGCGGSSGSSTSSSHTGTTAGQAALTIKLGDYSFTPANVTTKAGTVTITSPNDGKVQHELVLLKTDRNPASLPVHGDEVDEQGLEAKGVQNSGEIQEVGPGQTKSGSFKLAPGKYVMICNLPGHYKLGMYGSVTVK